ncbi:MAG: hypothetical protein M3O61_14865 [Gemmatimonadota bacterium]|nr:hypothetical protein [Gemmatimonadota bacterium]
MLELEMTSACDVRVEFLLPALGEIPEDKTQLTKTGKLSTRKMAQRDRVGLYSDLCTGIALRLIHETLRVLETVDVVEAFGLASDIDPATGHHREFVALHLQTSRQPMVSLNLDAVDPSSSFKSLGGVFLCDRKGELRPLQGVNGLQD